MLTDPIIITAALRTPMGNFNGAFKNIPSPQLGAQVIAALTKNNLKNKIDQVIMGCVLSAGIGQAPARQATLLAELSNTTPCTTINKMCGSGMKSVMIAYHEIQNKNAEIIIAGGMENMSRAPFLLQNARAGLRLGSQTMEDHLMQDGLINAYGEHLSMGAIAENCATEFKMTREEQDAFAIHSISRAIHATKSGFFKNEIVPINIHDKMMLEDEGIQKANIEKIPQLKPVFTKNGTITAANASSISDGAAALLLMRLSYAEKLGLKPIATIIGDHGVALAPEQFPIAPVKAINELLQKINWKINEVELFEINEAFAAVTLIAMKQLSIPLEKINVHGGACILGHPIGASGARILVTLIHALKQQNKKRGVAAICIGGGEATAMAIEIV